VHTEFWKTTIQKIVKEMDGPMEVHIREKGLDFKSGGGGVDGTGQWQDLVLAVLKLRFCCERSNLAASR
jgi:hypothetical protein